MMLDQFFVFTRKKIPCSHHCKANVMSRGNLLVIRFACKWIATLTLAMTGSRSLRGECNEPWQSTCNQIGLVAGLLPGYRRGLSHSILNDRKSVIARE